ncbi:hypothetical protein IAR55_000051 [Kwoniella newhampshirensis]|uniref:Secreted protein n=1 Tax=Kwoniella newhampshirensis TaxID=1651941 RepID=A0AAW0Z5S9_9TREE
MTPVPPSDSPTRSTSPSDPSSFVRDPHKLVAYLIPFPSPTNLPSNIEPPPLRFILYTPPPPPLLKPSRGEKEGLAHKTQRKWQQEVRKAKESDAKVVSWKGVKSRVTKGISWAVDHTTSADLDFVTRIPKDRTESHADPTSTSDGEGKAEMTTTKKTVKLEEMVIVYPTSMNVSSDELRAEFVNSLMRTKSKAERDAVIATGLLPVAAALDWALVFVGWIFGGALEVDGVWAASSINGAKTARSVTKRLASSTKSGDLHHSSNDTLQLSFVPSHRVEVLSSYLLDECIQCDRHAFNRPTHHAVTQDDVLESIGWTPSGQYEEKNWEDESWERDQVREDISGTMKKAAKAWDHWVKLYEKNPKKALKK